MLTLLAQNGAATSGNKVNLAGLWDQKWAEIAPGNEALLEAMGLVGLVVLVGALIMWVWRRNQGQSQGMTSLWPAMAIGALLSAPGVMLPAVLNIIDIVMNMVLNFLQTL